MFTTLRSLLLWKRNTNIFPYWQLSRKGSSKIYINRMQKAREENKKIKQNKTEWSQRYAYKQMKYRNAAWLRALLMCVRAYRTEYICNDETAMVEILPKSLAKLCAFYFLFILFSSLEFRFRLLLLFYGKDTFDAFGVRFACVSRRNAHIYTSHSKQCRTFFRWLFLFFFNSVHSLSSVVVVAAYPNTIHNINIRNINMFSVLIERRQSFLYSSIRYICACGEDDDDERHRVQARAREIANTHH